MTKELSKGIMNRSALKNRYTNGRLVKTSWHVRSRRISAKVLTKRRKRTTFPKLLQMGSKGFLHNENIALHIGDKTVTDCNKLAKAFNEYYINLVQNTIGNPTIKLQGSNNDKSTVETIIKIYEHHPSIELIKEHIQKENNDFNIKAASVGQINKIIKGLNLKKATGPDKIPGKIVKLAASIINSNLNQQ